MGSFYLVFRIILGIFYDCTRFYKTTPKKEYIMISPYVYRLRHIIGVCTETETFAVAVQS